MGNVPPPFYREGNQPKKSKTGLYIGITVGVLAFVLVMCGGLIYGGYKLFTGAAGFVGTIAQCPLTFEMTTEAAQAYAKDHDGKLPSKDKWQTELEPYYIKLKDKLANDIKKVGVLKLAPAPIDEALVCKMGEPVTGIYLNADVAGKKIADIKDPEGTPMFFEALPIKMSGTMPYVKQEASKSPKMFDETRDWMVWYVSGNKETFSSSESGRSIKISSDGLVLDKPTPPPAKAEDQPALPGKGN